LEWIEASFKVAATSVTVAILERRIPDVIAQLDVFIRHPIIVRKKLAQLTGLLTFMAGLVHTLYPFVAPLWGAIYSVTPSRLPAHLLHSRRVRHAFVWLRAMFLGHRRALRRTYYIRSSPKDLPWLYLAVDASPWGIGGILFDAQWSPQRYYYDEITLADCQTLNVKVGSPDYMTIFEALALLVALRLWSDEAEGMTLSIRTDNAGCGSVMSKMRSPNPSLNRIATELALDMVEHTFSPLLIDHIAGVTNLGPDVLSRMYSPKSLGKVPSELMNVTRTLTEPRTRMFWKSLEQKGSVNSCQAQSQQF
jgi:hypothetical protein